MITGPLIAVKGVLTSWGARAAHAQLKAQTTNTSSRIIDPFFFIYFECCPLTRDPRASTGSRPIADLSPKPNAPPPRIFAIDSNARHTRAHDDFRSRGDLDLTSLRDTLSGIYDSALDRCSPETLIDRVVADGASLGLYALDVTGERSASFAHEVPWPENSVHVLSVGKSAGRSLVGLDRALPGRIDRALVILPDDAEAPDALPPHTRVLHGEHPIPGAGSLAAGHAALDFVEEVEPNDLLIVMVSGGSSALLAAPIEPLEISDLSETNRVLLASGAPIEIINGIRSRLSRIKSGRLGRACRGELVTLVFSDVGGGPELVGSGPTISSSFDLGRAIDEYNLTERLPSRVLAPLVGSRPVRARPHPIVPVAGPRHLVAAAATALEHQGFQVVHALHREESPTVEDRAAQLHRVAQELSPGSAWVEVCEPVISLPSSPGTGGRSTHLALLVAKAIAKEQRVGALIAGSDGVDGTSNLAGAVIDQDSWLTLPAPNAALERYDSGTFLEQSPDGVTVLAPGPTGINLRDLHVVAAPLA
ncbi:MAG: DUF4147 domain-containing protein [Myxococcota bacterium]